ncbi:MULTISPECIES: hypothetical protein [unclassified Pseudomonas]|nr:MULTISPECIES: hypothetical protein [unclassified Pseudomonas]MDG9930963.1 hypothetical protein [Pseudomonas sp. GD04042]MDH0484118.1 hypothetical protein [Pseudomonas sp. GD04015]MDH0605685.1 hypothetical protein [Pseudomonas sp. GD03869]
MADDPATPAPAPEPATPGEELPEAVRENLEEVAPLPAPVPEPGPLLPR